MKILHLIVDKSGMTIRTYFNYVKIGEGSQRSLIFADFFLFWVGPLQAEKNMMHKICAAGSHMRFGAKNGIFC